MQPLREVVLPDSLVRVMQVSEAAALVHTVVHRHDVELQARAGSGVWGTEL